MRNALAETRYHDALARIAALEETVYRLRLALGHARPLLAAVAQQEEQEA